MANQVEELVPNVVDAHYASPKQCRLFISHLARNLQAARRRELERDRMTAPRFNVFKYLSDHELGLSSMIADLLDPAGEHGQGTRFLEAMLNMLPETNGRFGKLQPTATSPITVVTERPLKTGGRIDITVDIPLGSNTFCLAFENKPYARDQGGQLSTYLNYLKEEYGTHFLLLYLPPVHREPDEASLSQSEREYWQRHFRVMPYAVGSGSLGDSSLGDWIAVCRNRCEADGVRWFLESAERFINQSFGESTMTIEPGAKFVRDYLSTNPKYMRTALAVHDAWCLMRAEVCERFLKHLRNIVEDRLREEVPEIGTDFQVQCHYGGDEKRSNNLWIARNSWIQYEDPEANTGGRSAIRLENHARGPNQWFFGVHIPKLKSKMTDRERVRRNELEVSLRKHGLSLANSDIQWPYWEWPLRYKDWNPLVPDLYNECEARSGRITIHYADKLLAIAARAIPAINEVEGSVSNPDQ